MKKTKRNQVVRKYPKSVVSHIVVAIRDGCAGTAISEMQTLCGLSVVNIYSARFFKSKNRKCKNCTKIFNKLA
jgi:hypothetical protein